MLENSQYGHYEEWLMKNTNGMNVIKSSFFFSRSHLPLLQGAAQKALARSRLYRKPLSDRFPVRNLATKDVILRGSTFISGSIS
ncbi:hypothetical protein PO124_11420 [Bacillus licheniformis]|nr:hypothetical protein [Bacillus licheniformis]